MLKNIHEMITLLTAIFCCEHAIFWQHFLGIRIMSLIMWWIYDLQRYNTFDFNTKNWTHLYQIISFLIQWSTFRFLWQNSRINKHHVLLILKTDKFIFKNQIYWRIFFTFKIYLTEMQVFQGRHKLPNFLNFGSNLKNICIKLGCVAD
jgi:hypothetical protein